MHNVYILSNTCIIFEKSFHLCEPMYLSCLGAPSFHCITGYKVVTTGENSPELNFLNHTISSSTGLLPLKLRVSLASWTVHFDSCFHT